MTKEKLPLTNEDLCAQIQAGNKAACEILIEQNEKFLLDCIGKIGIKPEWGLDRDDLMQEGRIALVKAAETFQPTARKKFLTYAGKAIQNNTLDFSGKVACHETSGFIGFFRPRQRRRLWKPLPIGTLAAVFYHLKLIESNNTGISQIMKGIPTYQKIVLALIAKYMSTDFSPHILVHRI